MNAKTFSFVIAFSFLTACGSDSSSPEIDSDLDTIPDARDNCVQIANADQLNADGDSAGDACDAFPNDPSETKNFDGDALGDNADPDDDNDGYNDDVDEFPLDATEWADADQDRIGDNKDLNLTSSNPNSAMLERIFETGGAIKFISPQDKFSVGSRPLGASTHNIGDVNGDQLDDFLIGYQGYVKTVENVDYIYRYSLFIIWS